MEEQTVDIIEESNDEVDNWMYYDKDSRNDGSLFDNDTGQPPLIYAEPTELVSDNDDDEHNFLTINDDDNQNMPYNNELPDNNEGDDDNGDFSKHTLVLKETINDNGQLVEGYLCQECNIPYNSIESFLQYHPCTELYDENPEQPHTNTQQQEPPDKLWDLVENLGATNENDLIDDDDNEDDDIIDIKPNVNDNTNPTPEEDVSNNDVDVDNERYFCYECQQVFTDLTTAERHDCNNQVKIAENIIEPITTSVIESSDKQQVFRCVLCDKDYFNLRSFTNHQRWHKKTFNETGENKTLLDVDSICGICNTIFANEKNLKLHMKMHNKHTLKTIQEALPVGAQNEYNGLNQFFCEICNKSFDQKLLVIHKNMHQNVEEYNCSKCNKQFENLPSYEIHLQMHGDINAGGVRQLSPSKNLNDLIIDCESPTTSSNNTAGGSGGGGSGQRKHACQYCGKEFQRPYEKVKHERIHTGEKPYECEVCGKKFRVSYSLTLHLRTHTDIRPYVCATCNKRFKQQSVYVHHMKTHVNERAYKCDVCGKSFRTSVQLSGHKNSHSKPFNCTDCNRPFASMYAVKIHMKTHNKTHKANKNLKNRCGICGASYARLFALRYHLKEQHDVDIDPSQLLDAENIVNSAASKDMDAETAILMHAANEANVQNEQTNYLQNDEATEKVIEQQIDHEESIQPSSFSSNPYLDETEAATQAILNTEEIIVDNFHAEEIITDWLSSQP